jgi:amidophosphoribosyltransferase
MGVPLIDTSLWFEVVPQEQMDALRGNVGIGHCRYPTAGTKSLASEAQPL